jgi:dephospho-CoA kinase
VLVVALTGGIGSGKSTVGALLAQRGAVVIEADALAREVVEPGKPAYTAVTERFGGGVLTADGTIDRAALAAVVFADEAARKDLEAITHPAIGAAMLERLAAQADSERVVVLDIPLLSAKNRMGAKAVIVVDCPEEVAVSRLVAHRGFDAEDAWRRVAAQLSREERRALADWVIDNSNGRELLASEVERAWQWLLGLAAGDGAKPAPASEEAAQ